MKKNQTKWLPARWLWAGLLVTVLMVAAGCTAPLIQAPTPAAEASAPAGDPPPPAAPVSAPVVASEVFNGLPVGFTPEGFPFRGAPEADIVVYEYSDYGCPFCARYFVQTEPALNDAFVSNEQVRFVFRDFPIAQLHPNAPAAHVAALCVAEQGSAAKFWDMHDELFSTQTVWTNMSDPQAHLLKLAEEVGVDMTRFTDCIGSGTMEARIEQSINEGRALGITGTPTFNFVRQTTAEQFLLVGAQPYAQFADMVDALVAGETPAQAQQPQQQTQDNQGNGQIPFWATAEGLVPDPARPGYNVAGDLYRGNPDAKVVVIEFSDFQCPYCRRHTEETQPQLDTTFVETNQVMWVFKHFPLNIHPQAEAAGAAAECAADQQMFWPMHDLLFEHVDQWSISDPIPVFADYAAQLSLDLNQFNACLADGEGLARVQSDLNDGAPFVQGTPTFIVLFNGEGRIIPGALPADQFKQALQQVIDGTVQ
jgi:protein-disulfide isomerase